MQINLNIFQIKRLLFVLVSIFVFEKLIKASINYESSKIASSNIGNYCYYTK